MTARSTVLRLVLVFTVLTSAAWPEEGKEWGSVIVLSHSARSEAMGGFEFDQDDATGAVFFNPALLAATDSCWLLDGGYTHLGREAVFAKGALVPGIPVYRLGGRVGFGYRLNRISAVVGKGQAGIGIIDVAAREASFGYGAEFRGIGLGIGYANRQYTRFSSTFEPQRLSSNLLRIGVMTHLRNETVTMVLQRGTRSDILPSEGLPTGSNMISLSGITTIRAKENSRRLTLAFGTTFVESEAPKARLGLEGVTGLSSSILFALRTGYVVERGTRGTTAIGAGIATKAVGCLVALDWSYTNTQLGDQAHSEHTVQLSVAASDLWNRMVKKRERDSLAAELQTCKQAIDSVTVASTRRVELVRLAKDAKCDQRLADAVDSEHARMNQRLELVKPFYADSLIVPLYSSLLWTDSANVQSVVDSIADRHSCEDSVTACIVQDLKDEILSKSAQLRDMQEGLNVAKEGITDLAKEAKGEGDYLICLQLLSLVRRYWEPDPSIESLYKQVKDRALVIGATDYLQGSRHRDSGNYFEALRALRRAVDGWVPETDTKIAAGACRKDRQYVEYSEEYAKLDTCLAQFFQEFRALIKGMYDNPMLFFDSLVTECDSCVSR